ncbi:protein SPT2 homolog [Ovis canadensis]|uniref:protein SPT2 homolog n=1 Tax=Ovis canadensis TaxID=37174 RepID=UPI003752B222
MWHVAGPAHWKSLDNGQQEQPVSPPALRFLLHWASQDLNLTGLKSSLGFRLFDCLPAEDLPPEALDQRHCLAPEALRVHWDFGLLGSAALACNQPQALSLIGALLSPSTRPEQPGRQEEQEAARRQGGDCVGSQPFPGRLDPCLVHLAGEPDHVRGPSAGQRGRRAEADGEEARLLTDPAGCASPRPLTAQCGRSDPHGHNGAPCSSPSGVVTRPPRAQGTSRGTSPGASGLPLWVWSPSPGPGSGVSLSGSRCWGLLSGSGLWGLPLGSGVPLQVLGSPLWVRALGSPSLGLGSLSGSWRWGLPLRVLGSPLPVPTLGSPLWVRTLGSPFSGLGSGVSSPGRSAGVSLSGSEVSLSGPGAGVSLSRCWGLLSGSPCWGLLSGSPCWRLLSGSGLWGLPLWVWGPSPGPGSGVSLSESKLWGLPLRVQVLGSPLWAWGPSLGPGSGVSLSGSGRWGLPLWVWGLLSGSRLWGLPLQVRVLGSSLWVRALESPSPGPGAGVSSPGPGSGVSLSRSRRWGLLSGSGLWGPPLQVRALGSPLRVRALGFLWAAVSSSQPLPCAAGLHVESVAGALGKP